MNTPSENPLTPPREPERIGDYRLLERLGEGASAAVYRCCLAEDPTRQYAIKLTKGIWDEADLETRVRFEQEAELLSRLTQENIVRLEKFGVHEGRLYLVMELARGQVLSEWVGSGRRVGVEEAGEILRQAALGLAHAHGKGILHRDVKPSNVVVGLTKTGVEVKLLDFGLSRLAEGAKGGAAGTFLYMSPEQLGILPQAADERSDLYSLGLMMVELLMGRHPYAGQDLRELIHSHAAVMPALPEEVPAGLRELVLSLARKDPGDRYQSAKAVAEDAGRFLERYRNGDGSAFELNLKAVGDKPGLPRFTGRERELGQLRDWYGTAKGGTMVVGTVCGLSGHGKTRLMAEAAGEWTRSVVGWGRGKAYGQASAYGLVAEVLRGIAKAPLSNEMLNRIRGAVGERAAELVRLAPELAEVVGPGVAVEGLTPEQRQERFMSAVVDFVKSLSESGAPVVLLFDDVQWADEGSLEFVRRLVRSGGDIGSVVLLGYRKEEVTAGDRVDLFLKELGETKPLGKVEVGPLGDGDIRKIVESMLGGEQAAVGEAVSAHAGGSPLYAVELVHALAENGAIRRGEMTWEVVDAAKLTEMRYSDNLVQTIVGRLERLTEEDRAVLALCAATGRMFEFRDVAGAVELRDGVAGRDAGRKVAEVLKAAMETRLVARTAAKYGFTHDKVREAIYGKLGKDEQTELHGLVARAMEREGMEEAERVYAVANHFGKSKEEEPAMRYAMRAGAMAGERNAHREALDFYEQAEWRLERMPDTDQTREWRIRVWEGLGDSGRMLGQYEKALGHLKKALNSMMNLDDRVRIMMKIGRVFRSQGKMAMAALELEESLLLMGQKVPKSRIGLFLSIGNELLIQVWHNFSPPSKKPNYDNKKRTLCLLLSEFSLVNFLLDTQKSLWGHLKHLNYSERHNVLDQQAQAYVNHGPVCGVVGMYSRGIKYGKRGLVMFQELGNHFGTAQARNYLLLNLFPTCQWKEANEQGTLAESELERLGDRWGLLYLLCMMATTLVQTGEWSRARAFLEKAQRIGKELNHYSGLAYILGIGSKMQLFGQVNPRVILDESNRLLPLCRKTGESLSLCMLGIAKGVALSRMGRLEESEKAFQEVHQYRKTNKLYTNDTDPLPLWLDTALLRWEKTSLLSEKMRQKENIEWILRQNRWVILPPFVRSEFQSLRAKWLWLKGRHWKAHKLWSRIFSIEVNRGNIFAQSKILLNWGTAIFGVDQDRGENILRSAVPLLQKMGDFPSLGLLAEYLPELRREKNNHMSENELIGSTTINSISKSGTHGNVVEAQRFEALVDISLEFGSLLNLDQLFQKLVDSGARMFGAERAYLYLTEGDALVERAVYRMAEGPEMNQAVSRTILDRVKQEGHGLVTADAQTDMAEAASVVATGVRSVMCVPLKFQDKILGVLYLDNRLVKGLFSDHDLKVLEAFGAQAAVALENARLFGTQEKSRWELKQLYDASKELMGVLDRRKIYRSLLSRVRTLMGGGAAAIGLYEDGQISVRLQEGFDARAIGKIEDRLRRARVTEARDELIEGAGVLQWVPLWANEELEGVLVVGGVKERGEGLLAHLGTQCSMALHNARLYELAITDELTQVYQRRYYEMVLKELETKKERFGLILIDLNDFKLINDTLGHAVGDRVLKEVGRTMRKTLRVSDLPVRTGGDEFAVVLPGESADQIERVVEKLREAIVEIKIEEPGHPPPRVWASFGYGVSQEGNLAALKEMADARMYEDKRRQKAGRGQTR